MKRKNWVFGVTDFIGNPKWLYLYLKEKHPEISTTWIADNEDRLNKIKEAHPEIKVLLRDSIKGKRVLSNAEVYVEEQFREFYPEDLSDNCVYLNLWHGVGLKNIEINGPFNGELSERIMKKSIRYFDTFYKKTLFLATSEAMANHFEKNVITPKEHFIFSDYPKNIVPKLLKNYKFKIRKEKEIKSATNVVMFAPTYRDLNFEGIFSNLIPNISKLEKALEESNSFFIVNLHPKMRESPDYLEMYKSYKSHPRFLFIEDTDDIYEYFNYIDYSIIDYSSIFYDLMASGVDKFVRYVPDLEEYATYHPLMSDYKEMTYGHVSETFDELLEVIKNPQTETMIEETKKKELMDYFFNYSNFTEAGIEKIITSIDEFQVLNDCKLRELNSFDIIDTIIDRDTTRPVGIFHKMQEIILDTPAMNFPKYFKDDYIRIRMQAENAVRANKKRTQLERASDVVEVTLEEIVEQIAFVYGISDEQKKWLADQEVQAEIESIRPIHHRIALMHKLADEGQKVIMISDMYLSREVINQMLKKVDSRLLDYDLYLSSETGYQKSTGLLYQYIFFNEAETFSKWTHYGDNKLADETVPAKYAINTVYHDLLNFNTYENRLVAYTKTYDSYRVANLMRDFRTKYKLGNEMSKFNKEESAIYYAYSYVGLYLVPYVYWTLNHALENGREVVYFVTRDGNLLKPIADAIIKETGWHLKTKLIYGSRKAWRVPGIDLDAQGNISETVFGPFGLFQTSFESFEKLLKAAELTEEEFISFFPSLKDYREKQVITSEEVISFRSIAKDNHEYNKHLLKISEEKRKLVSKYFKQEIDPTESFTIVEFWGRGYTQNSFRNILRKTFNDDSLNSEFYYARSIYQSEAGSIRYNLTNSAKDITFIEFLFNTVPMKTVSGYKEVDGKVLPVHEKQHSDFYQYFEKYTLEFASDFAKIDFYDINSVMSVLFDFSTYYFEKFKKDKMIVDNFSQLGDNIAIGGEDQEYAPAFTPYQVLTTKVTTLKTMTKSLPMSLEKSSKRTNDVFRMRQKTSKFFRKVVGKK